MKIEIEWRPINYLQNHSMPKQVKKQGDQKEVEVAEWTNQQVLQRVTLSL